MLPGLAHATTARRLKSGAPPLVFSLPRLRRSAHLGGAGAGTADGRMAKLKLKLRSKTRPITSNIPVEVLEGSNDPPSIENRRSLRRQQTLRMAKSGRKVGEWTRRQRMRRMLVSCKWQLFLLLTAAVDIGMLVAEVELGVDTMESDKVARMTVHMVTAAVLGVFVLDLLLRVYTYRGLLLRCGCIRRSGSEPRTSKPLLTPPGPVSGQAAHPLEHLDVV